MKRPLLIAALLAVAPIATGGAAQANVDQMFNIKTPAAGTVDFRGEGTANFNQSLGTNNNFNVGSSTRLGVSASASSTSDYSSTGNALLKLDGSSRLQQTIGTASSAFNASTAAESSARSADVTANSVAAQKVYGTTINETFADSWNSGSGYEWYTQEELDLAASVTDENDHGYIKGISDSASTEVAVEGFYGGSSSAGWEYSDSYNSAAETAFEESYREEYNDAYSVAYEVSASSATAATSNTDATGVISGDFVTKTSGSADSTIGGLSASLDQSSTAAATQRMDASRDGFSTLSVSEQSGFGLTASSNTGYDDDSDATTANVDFEYGMDSSGFSTAEQEAYDSYAANYESAEVSFQAQYDSAYQESYAESYSAANSALERTTESSVTVTGIGVIADVNADASSTFEASSTLTEAADRNGNGNGNASADAYLSTSSMANQTSNDTASAFMQAFSITGGTN
jgi:hypothetical protein